MCFPLNFLSVKCVFFFSCSVSLLPELHKAVLVCENKAQILPWKDKASSMPLAELSDGFMERVIVHLITH